MSPVLILYTKLDVYTVKALAKRLNLPDHMEVRQADHKKIDGIEKRVVYFFKRKKDQMLPYIWIFGSPLVTVLETTENGYLAIEV